jgi:molecular chaperone GrpE
MNEKSSEKSEKIDIKIESEASDEINSKNEKEEQEEIPFEEMSREELLNKIDEIQEKSNENFDKYVRSQAEIDNIIKRNKKEKEEWIKYSNEKLIKDLLQVIDNLENALNHSESENSLNALIEGVELTLKGLKDTLKRSGLEDIKTEGEEFDPCFHHAVLEEVSKSVEKGKILKELQKGYTLNQRLIRPAMVIISKGGEKDDGQAETTQGACEK